MRASKSKRNVRTETSRQPSVVLWAVGVLAVAAAYVQWSSRRAERETPPNGKFLSVQGTRLHYLDPGGMGPVVLLLHGNGSMARELEASGIITELASDYRVI